MEYEPTLCTHIYRVTLSWELLIIVALMAGLCGVTFNTESEIELENGY